ncbi:hypothetical protein A3460_05330 [Enterobacter roggenkampii]|uniref:hypothetical protein n=1 Tax=Enterobacter roggenkampii TaxID=1812935 RepID=UPI0007B36FFC|nr:hypothetical protein [Enterobacter roggenkampii]KZP80125.1 hypothetical protein A3460_05330 [Enterobacter roggenkampii]
MSTPLSQTRTAMTPQQYANEWGKSSSDHKRFSDYKWIASHIINPKTVLEIGCGVGYGTQEVLALGAVVVSIEINTDLLNVAASNLTQSGYKVKKINLSQINTINIDSDIQCYLVEADIFDKNLDSLFQSINFDHVLFSFFGAAPAHAAKGLNTTVALLDNKFASSYREMGTTRAFEIKKMCNAQCKLIIVDRIHQDQGYQAKEVRGFYLTDLARRLNVPETVITAQTRKNQALQTISSSKLNYINNGSFNKRLGTPLIVIATI